MKKGLFVFLFMVLIECSVFAQINMRDFWKAKDTSGGLMSLLPFILILLIIIPIVARGRNNGGPVLVLKKFNLNEKENEFLQIEGRASGFLSWILSLCGIDPVTSLSCNRQSIKHEKTGIRYGKETVNIPLVAVTGVSSGINKPFSLLVLGIIFILGGIIGAISIPYGKTNIFFGGLVIGAVYLIFYSLKKIMFFKVYNGGDKPIVTIRIKKSIIEGQSIDEKKYESAANLLNRAVFSIHYNLAMAKNMAPKYKAINGGPVKPLAEKPQNQKKGILMPG